MHTTETPHHGDTENTEKGAGRNGASDTGGHLPNLESANAGIADWSCDRGIAAGWSAARQGIGSDERTGRPSLDDDCQEGGGT